MRIPRSWYVALCYTLASPIDAAHLLTSGRSNDLLHLPSGARCLAANKAGAAGPRSWYAVLCYTLALPFDVTNCSHQRKLASYCIFLQGLNTWLQIMPVLRIRAPAMQRFATPSITDRCLPTAHILKKK